MCLIKICNKRTGFKNNMDFNEALNILNIKNIKQNILEDAYKKVFASNHPDRGGSPYIASKINEARNLIKKSIKLKENKCYF